MDKNKDVGVWNARKELSTPKNADEFYNGKIRPQKDERPCKGEGGFIRINCD